VASLATRSLILWISPAVSGVTGVGVPSALLVVAAGGVIGVRSPVPDIEATFCLSLVITRGPVFRDKRGNRSRAGYHELAILTQFEWLQANVDDLISPNVNVFEDMGVGRGFRRGSNGQAVIQGVSQPLIDMNNRWSICERAK